jgi:thiamine-phosphate pyrophosphorylase
LSHPAPAIESSHVNAGTDHRAEARVRGLYLITPDEPDTALLLARVGQVLDQASLLQYRNKRADRALRQQQAEALMPLCARHGVPLIINDDWRLARDCGAQGAHLGLADGAIEEARAGLGRAALVGATCHGDLGRATAAAASGASYVAFGAFHPSPTKPDAPRARQAVLQEAASLGLPRVAIGGITPENAPALIAAGADLVATISGVFDAPDPAAAARAYRDCFA